MKYLISALAFFLISISGTYAQKLDLDKISFFGGLNFSSFIYDNTQVSFNNNIDYKTDASLGLNFEFLSKRHVLRPELLYKRIGAVSTNNNIKLKWSLSYLELNIAYLFKVLNAEKFSISPGLSYGVAYMIDGTQDIGQVRYSADDDNFLNRLDLTGNFLLNFNFKITKSINMFLEYRFGISLLNLEKDDDQITRNMYHTLGFGLGISLDQNK